MKAGIVCQKKEMTKIWVKDRFVPVTVLSLLPQEVMRFKSTEKDGYQAVLVWVVKSKKWDREVYKKIYEFKTDEEFTNQYKTGDKLTSSILEWIEQVRLTGISKWKGFQWAMKRFHLQGWPQTHGSKFHRAVGSMGNRKPRRTMKWHPHAGHMWLERISLANKVILKTSQLNYESLVIIKWSVPGHYNSFLQLTIEK